MPMTCSKTGNGPVAATAADFWIGREVDDVPPGWIDHMIRRLFDQWNRQMIRFEQTGEIDIDKALQKSRADAEQDTLERSEREARVLTQLQRSLTELIKLETGRATLRANKMVDGNEGARAALLRELGKLAGAGNAPQIPGDDE